MNIPLQMGFDLMLERYGPQHWWPGETKLEIVVGAVLTQNTAWKNVELAIENLREAQVLSLAAINQILIEELQELIRPAGYFRLKSRRLKNLTSFIEDKFGSLEDMFQLDQMELRERLLSVNGIGPETADSILLYAGEYPTFVIDAYTHRIAKRHGWIEYEADYHALKSFFEERLPADEKLFNEFHALIVRVGKDHCRKQPKCEQCPLAEMLPSDGPICEPP